MKVIVNGSQMHFGRGWLSYRPLLTEPGERYQYQEGVLEPYSSVGHNSDNRIGLDNGEEACIMVQSQWPKIFIDPGQSMGGEMEFPFFFGANWFSIPDRNWVATPSFSEVGDPNFNGPLANNQTTPDKCYGPYGATHTHMGVVHSSSLQELKHANGALDPVTIQVFLWATDVKMSVPTSKPHPDAQPLGVFTPRGRTEYVPSYLGDLAKPGSDIADRLELGSSLLSTSGDTVGIDDTNDMSISSFAQRECWLDRFTWPVDSPAETLLWQARVTPQYYKMQGATAAGLTTIDGVPALVPTPMAYCALPFGYWRGSIKYRVQIVASNLHRGRIRIVYDPSRDLLARGDVNEYPEELMNLQYSRTIDIAGGEGRDFTFEVGYMQSKPYLPLQGLMSQLEDANDPRYHNYGGPVDHGVGAPVSIDETSSTNGAISIYVLNRLAVPSTQPGLNNDVSINVYCSAGRDMSFQMPTTRNLASLAFTDPLGFPSNYSRDPIPTSVGNTAARRAQVIADAASDGVFIPRMESASMGATEGENVPTDPPLAASFGQTTQPQATMARVAFGEDMDSWDTLMKRWVLYNRDIFCPSDGEPVPGYLGGYNSHVLINPDYPPFPGPAPNTRIWNDLTLDGALVNYPTDRDGVPYPNNGLSYAPPSKVVLSAPVQSLEPDEVDLARLLRVNPGCLTMLHFVTRLFVARKGSIKNKYVLNANSNSSAPGGTHTMMCKRLSDSGVINGRGFLLPGVNAANNSQSNDVRRYMPASGGLWDQAYFRIGLAEVSDDNIANIRRLQLTNGYIQSGCSVNVAPDWFNQRIYPGNEQGHPLEYTAESHLTSNLLLENLFDGSHVTTTRQQPVIEVEIPFYMNTRFILNDVVLNNTSSTTAHAIRFDDDGSTGSIGARKDMFLERYVAPGGDFSLFYLANAPQLNLNYAHVYNTIVETDAGNEVGIANYSSLKYHVANRQESAAFRALGHGSVAHNSVPTRPYYYEMHANQVKPYLPYTSGDP